DARGTVLEALGSAEAVGVYLGGIALLESWRGRLVLGDLRRGIAEPRLGVYEGAVRLLLRDGRTETALEVAERARGRMLLELMADRDRRGVRTRAHRDALLERLQEADEARRSVTREEVRARYAREVERLIAELDSVEAVHRSLEATAAIRDPAPATAEAIRRGLLAPGTALLAWFWGDSAVYGWWATASQVRGARLGDADSLAAVVEFLRGAIESPTTGDLWQSPARRAYELLVRPLRPSDEERLLVVADGPLAYVPLEVFVPDDGAPPLGATHLVHYGPSASVLLALARAPRLVRWERAMLAVGDPAPAAGAVEPGAAEERAAPLRPLPYAAQEARALDEIFADEGADLLVGRRASLDRWLRMRPERYRYLHFAAHARVSDRRPARTALVLAGGRLDLARIGATPLRAELVTLSACETALGRRVRGEGVVGLPYAFLAAGARGALVTLWPVTDEPASRMMRDFYVRLRRGATAAAAMREVRRAGLASGGPDGHPSRWASFVLVGAMSPDEPR
ncbi:MAG TPA: CHAT domain-containing protein, partial [Gemmatimonadaceae bacterium]